MLGCTAGITTPWPKLIGGGTGGGGGGTISDGFISWGVCISLRGCAFSACTGAPNPGSNGAPAIAFWTALLALSTLGAGRVGALTWALFASGPELSKKSGGFSGSFNVSVGGGVSDHTGVVSAVNGEPFAGLWAAGSSSVCAPGVISGSVLSALGSVFEGAGTGGLGVDKGVGIDCVGVASGVMAGAAGSIGGIFCSGAGGVTGATGLSGVWALVFGGAMVWTTGTLSWLGTFNASGWLPPLLFPLPLPLSIGLIILPFSSM